jgi:NAD(P)-dependent dehydrogenase (short-subunit alcohol dehydrogenase family)
MPKVPRTVIVTSASQGIGAAIVKTFLERDYSVVAIARNITKSANSYHWISWRWSTETSVRWLLLQQSRRLR